MDFKIENLPKVSVIICVYNAGVFLKPSVLSIVNQTYKNLEIIIIDDGSTDGCIATIEDIEDHRIRIIRQKNAGKPSALNRGLEELTGEYFAQQDADDISNSVRIEHQIKCLQENPSLAAVFCGYDIILDGHHFAPNFSPKSISECETDINAFRMPGVDATAIFQVSKIKDFKFNVNYTIGSILDYILRIGEKYPMMVLGECLYSYRILTDSLSHKSPDASMNKVVEIKRDACKRRNLDPQKHLSQIKLEQTAKKTKRNQGVDLAFFFILSVKDFLKAGKRRKAILTGLQCVKLKPFDLIYYKAIIYALSPVWLMKFISKK